MPLFDMHSGEAFDPGAFLTWVVALALGITVHEFGHAWRAEKAGDPTPRAAGRMSINPLDHYDPLGSTLILLVGFGWAKPVPTNPAMFRHPRRDEIMVSLWGPLANIITALILAVPLWLGVAGAYSVPIVYVIRLQLVLAVFNLIPVYPLDGSHILSALLPVDKARRLDAVYRQYGMFLLLGVLLVAGPVIWTVVRLLLMAILSVGPALEALVGLLTGG